VVDDFKPFRSFISLLLSKHPNLGEIYEAGDGQEAVEKAEQLKPDVILMDIGLPGLNGLDAARRIREVVPSTKIVFLTQETADEIVKTALSLDTWGYIVKQKVMTDLLAGLDAILQGKRFVSSGLGETQPDSEK
jgi:DNA-binding NarL/FixJ family response regulator